jgi:hypothetical protein
MKGGDFLVPKLVWNKIFPRSQTPFGNALAEAIPLPISTRFEVAVDLRATVQSVAAEDQKKRGKEGRL